MCKKILDCCNNQILLSCSQQSNSIEEQDINRIGLRKLQKLKIRKRKQYPKQKSQWTQCHVLRFFMFYLKYKTEHPYSQLSWLDWKVDNLYNRMSTFINLNKLISPKNKKQCKSADQRFKKIHFLQNEKYGLGKTDIIITSYQKIKKYLSESEDIQCQQIFDRFNQKSSQKSNHMKLCEKYKQLNEKTLKSAENLYNLIMNSPFHINPDISSYQTFIYSQYDDK